jgi:hypothetical protein
MSAVFVPFYFPYNYNIQMPVQPRGIVTPYRTYYIESEYDEYADDRIKTDYICVVNHFHGRVIAIHKFDFSSQYFDLQTVIDTFEPEPVNCILEEMNSEYLISAYEDYDIIKIKDGVLYLL